MAETAPGALFGIILQKIKSLEIKLIFALIRFPVKKVVVISSGRLDIYNYGEK